MSAARPCAAGRAGRQADCQQGHPRASGVEEIVTAFGEHRERMGRDPHRHQPGHEGQVEPQNQGQALRSGHGGNPMNSDGPARSA